MFSKGQTDAQRRGENGETERTGEILKEAMVLRAVNQSSLCRVRSWLPMVAVVVINSGGGGGSISMSDCF